MSYSINHKETIVTKCPGTIPCLGLHLLILYHCSIGASHLRIMSTSILVVD